MDSAASVALAWRLLKKEARKLGPEEDRVSLLEVCIQPGPEVVLDMLAARPALSFPSEMLSASPVILSGSQSAFVTGRVPLCQIVLLSTEESLTPRFSVLAIELRM